jgi:hypothetical protein
VLSSVWDETEHRIIISTVQMQRSSFFGRNVGVAAVLSSAWNATKAKNNNLNRKNAEVIFF